MNQYLERSISDGIHEEYGVFGIYDFGGGGVASTIYYGLFVLQHRGQESCDIVVNDTEGPKGKVNAYKGVGFRNEVFTPETLEGLHGNIGVGHVHYSTAGSSTRENAQPLVLNYVEGTLDLAHNGNLTNAPALRRELEYTGVIFQIAIGLEVIAYYIARERIKTVSAEEAVANTVEKIEGAYALVIMNPRKLIGVKDPFGFKPLCTGKKNDAYILASESCALDTLGASLIRGVEPGEIVTITKDGIQSDTSMCLPDRKKQARCAFEYTYFARPDSAFDGVSVYHSRIYAGRCLAKDSPVKADLVVGASESGNATALGYSMGLGIPYGTVFMKNSYVGRTFIKLKQSSRVSSVRVKLNVLKEAVAGKRAIMADDFIVRGITSHQIVRMLKGAGVKEVHVKVSAPPFLHSCYFGTGIPSEEQLIAYGKTVEEVHKLIGIDSLSYLQMNRLSELVEGLSICTGCFNGEYPIASSKEDIRGDYTR